MIDRMSSWNCRSECWGEDRETFHAMAVPIMQAHDGFVEAMLLAEPEKDQRIAFTVWRDQTAYDAFCAHPDLEKITRIFAHMYVEGIRPRPMDYEVRASGRA